jgi:SAM-dependent methyltransferase
MTMFERVHTPSFDGATGWLNSEPLGPAELKGHVVLVNFWTLTCINWLRQEPYVRAWSRAYRDDGLIVIGFHTPPPPRQVLVRRPTGTTSAHRRRISVTSGRLYQLVRAHDAFGERTLEITFLEPGAEAYSFTFG